MRDIVNPHVAKILLAAEDGDSINTISKKIDASYRWTQNWVSRLEEIRVVERPDGVTVTDSDVAEAFEAVAKGVLRRGVELGDAYL